ncbi:STAS domain-containing protein [Polyangium aurulentum]|uniref:STAS domain-containing protein n=1 Tax=Polyangium aurulentum TaxID=2567896 RepID=UPI00197E88D1|nr:STAS domain-containing protein [Polyangium aurulentum]UQA63275.1 STAS domain-containing protein [Polyangium aurulentum]
MMMETQRIPIVRLSGKLIVSIQTALSDTVVDRLQQDVAAACERGDARGLVVDVSGVDVLDSYITRSLRDLAVMARLMGVETVVCGLRPAVAMTLVEMGMELPGVRTALNLDRALALLDSLQPEGRVRGKAYGLPAELAGDEDEEGEEEA